MMIKKLENYKFINTIKTDIIMILIFSFLGFCIENIWLIFRYSYIDNRNMYMPFILGYGLAINAIYYFIGTPDTIFKNILFNNKHIGYILYFFICFILVSIGEILLGTFVFKTGGYNYWDYSSLPLHITRYTTIPTSLGFAFILTILMKYTYIPLRKKVSNIVVKIPLIYFILIAIALLTDFFLSFKNMYMHSGGNNIWKINTKGKFSKIKAIFNIGG